VDSQSSLLRDVRAALLRIRDGSFGTCIHCEWAINPRRLAAVPWAPLCIECQEAADHDKYEAAESLIDTLVKVA
jgi:RNA polymerase-binding transcription factor DksA